MNYIFIKHISFTKLDLVLQNAFKHDILAIRLYHNIPEKNKTIIYFCLRQYFIAYVLFQMTEVNSYSVYFRVK